MYISHACSQSARLLSAIRQVKEELEGRATYLASALSAPFHTAPPSCQLLGPSVKFNLALTSVDCGSNQNLEAGENEAAQTNIDGYWPSVLLVLIYSLHSL